MDARNWRAIVPLISKRNSANRTFEGEGGFSKMVTVIGTGNAANGNGVQGTGFAANNGIGVVGNSLSPNGIGVRGSSTSGAAWRAAA